MTLLNIYMGGICVGIIYWFVGIYCLSHDATVLQELAEVCESTGKMWIMDLSGAAFAVITLIASTLLWPLILLLNVVLIVDFLLRNN